MQAITLGNPNLFVKGMVEVVITDPETGNIIGYDNVASESAVNTSVNMGEITGGFGNPLLMNIPDTTRITGTLTSQAFSLQQRALMTGGQVKANGVVPYCETVTADSDGKLTVTRTPAKAYGQKESDSDAWCYVRRHGEGSYNGTNYQLDEVSKEVLDFTGVVGGQYDVFYFTQWASSEILALPASFNPSVATIRLKYGVYSKQNNSVSNGTLAGYLYFIVPRAQFTGDAGIGANQTANSTTSYDWTALMPDNNFMDCANCGANNDDYAYYIYVPCGDEYQSLETLAVIGGVVTLSADNNYTATVPLVGIMKNGTTINVPPGTIHYAKTGEDGQNDITVSAYGVASATAQDAGKTAYFEAELPAETGDDYRAYFAVTVA